MGLILEGLFPVGIISCFPTGKLFPIGTLSCFASQSARTHLLRLFPVGTLTVGVHSVGTLSCFASPTVAALSVGTLSYFLLGQIPAGTLFPF